MPSPPCDLLISAALIVTNWRAPVLRDAAVAICDGTIAAVGALDELRAYWQPRREIHLEQQLLTPGLVNGHCALGERLGHANQGISASEQTLGIDLELLELLSHGVTSIADTSPMPQLVAQRCVVAGIRAQVTAPIADAPNPFSDNAADARARAYTMMDEWRQTPLINVAFGPALVGPLDSAELARVQILADEIEAPVTLPLGGSGEPGWIVQLDELGMLNPRLQGLYNGTLTSAEIALLGERRISVIYQPLHCAQRPDMLAELAALANAGCNLTVGTGSSADANPALLLSAAELAQRFGCAPTTAAALQQISDKGAMVQGRDAGGIAAEQPADLVSFDLHAPVLQPDQESITTGLLRGGSSLRAENVWIDGVQVLSDQAHCTLNRTEILTRAAQWRATMAL